MPGILRFHTRNIGRRILALTGACIAVVLITFGVFYASREEQTIRALSERDMQRLMESVIRSIESIMLPGQASLAQSFAERLRSVPDVVDFRVLRTDGNEAFRDNLTLKAVNARLGAARFELREREEVVPVLPGGDPGLRQAMDLARPTLSSADHRDDRQGRLRTFVYAIPNQVACHGCHGAQSPYLGAVKLTASMSAIDAVATRARHEGWIATAIALIAALVLAGAIIRRSVVRPIEEVTAAMRRAADGNLDQTVPVLGDDEIGQMAQSFNIMVARLNEVYQGLRQEQDKLNTVIQSTGEGVVVTDATGSVVLVNDAAVRLLGKRRERIVQEGFHKLLDDAAIVETLLQRQTGRSPTPFKISYKGRSLRVIAATIHAKDGSPTGSAALLRDITPARDNDNGSDR